MNIDCDKIIKELNYSEDEFSSNFQKIMILRVIQQISFEMLIGGRIVFTLIHFLKSLISGRMRKMIPLSFMGYSTKWCPRNHLSTNR